MPRRPPGLKAEAVERMVQSREKTHRQALRLLESLAWESDEEAGRTKKAAARTRQKNKIPEGAPAKSGRAFSMHFLCRFQGK